MYNLPLIETKLAPPVLTRVIRRGRLLERLAPRVGAKLYLLSAEPGYGKTTLLASLAQETRIPVVWYRLDPLDEDPVLFMRYLIAGTRKALPAFGKMSLGRIAQAGAAAYRERGPIWQVFLAELAERATDGLLYVLDDYHLVDGSAEIRGFVRDMAQRTPDDVRIYLGARDRVKLPLGRLRTTGGLVVVGRDDLRFGPEEIREYLRGDGKQLSSEEASDLWRETDGWIAGLVLLGQAGSPAGAARGANGETALLSALSSNREIYNFLSHEVFERLPRPLQSLLEKTSVLETVNPALADRVLGVEGSGRLLEEAEARRIFTFRLKDEESAYRYQPLFKRFLVERLKGQLGRQGVARLHLEWARGFEEDGDPVNALHHYLEAGESQAGGRLIDGLAEEYLGGGHADTLLRRLDRLDALPGKSPRMDLIRARALYHLARPEEAAGFAREALGDARNAQDLRREFAAATCLGECLLALGQWREATELLASALGMASDRKDRVAVLTLLGCSSLARCKWEEACGYYHEALDMTGASGGVEEARIRGFLGVVCWWQGDFGQAERLMVLAAESLRGMDDRVALVRTLNNLSFCLCAQAKYGAARRINREVLELSARHYLGQGKGGVLDNLGRLQAATGKYDAAISNYKESLDIFSTAKDVPEQLFVLNHLAACRRRAGDLVGSLRDHRHACRMAEGVKMPYGLALSALNLGVILSDLGRNSEAEAQWERAREISERLGLGYLLFRLKFYRARLAFRSKRSDEALAGLSESLGAARKFQYHHFLIQEGKIDLAFLVKGFEAGIERPYLAFLFEKIGKSALEAVPGLLEGPDSAQREAALRLLARLPLAQVSRGVRQYLREGEAEAKRLAGELLHRSSSGDGRRFDLLTSREMEIARLVTAGLTNRDIADRLYVSEATVKTHLNRVFHKLQVENRSRLVWELLQALGELRSTNPSRP